MWENILNTLTNIPVAGDVVAKPAIAVPALLTAMLRASTHVSDLIFSPAGMPHIEVSGQLVPVKSPGCRRWVMMTPAALPRNSSPATSRPRRPCENRARATLRTVSPDNAGFGVNIFTQPGSHAIVMRVHPPKIPTFAELKLPQQLAEIANLKNGIVLITGPTGN